MRWLMIAAAGAVLIVAVSLAQEADTPTSQPTQPREQTEADLFDANAFPPTLPDTEWHQDAWVRQDCLRCHETGVEDAPIVRHEGMPPILLRAKCRTCHVIAPGQKPRGAKKILDPPTGEFNVDAFPPMIPASGSHRRAWRRDDCLLCHEDGTHNAPIVMHTGMPTMLLKAKCRTCHVQVRSIEAGEQPR